MRTRGVVVVLAVALLAGGAGCGSSGGGGRARDRATTSAAAATAPMEGIGFRTVIPAGWAVAHESEPRGSDSYAAVPRGFNGGSRPFMVTRVPWATVPASQFPGFDLAHGSLEQLLPLFVGISGPADHLQFVVSPHPVTVGGEPAASTTTTYVQGGTQRTDEAILVRHGDCFYVIGISATSVSFVEERARLSPSVDRFTWTEVGATGLDA